MNPGGICASVDSRNVATVEAIVRAFYSEVWNNWNDAIIDKLLTEDIAFRGSLGVSAHDRSGFRAYRDTVRETFPDLVIEVLDIVATSSRAAARLRITGTVSGGYLAETARGQRISYDAAALFTLVGRRVSELWVLGDLHGLTDQLGERFASS